MLAEGDPVELALPKARHLLDDRKVDDGEGNSSKDWGYTNDNYLRPNKDRYWFRMKNNQTLPLQFKSQIDLDIVSDQPVLIRIETRAGHGSGKPTAMQIEEIADIYERFIISGLKQGKLELP